MNRRKNTKAKKKKEKNMDGSNLNNDIITFIQYIVITTVLLLCI